jgi:hypothetical protein
MLGSCLVAAQLAASREELSSMELVSSSNFLRLVSKYGVFKKELYNGVLNIAVFFYYLQFESAIRIYIL